jgi:DNA-directed RNA polymerase specialized sigma24 family protein
LVQDVLVAMYPRWSRIVRGGQVDAYASRVLVGKHVDARRRPGRRERPVDTVPDSIDYASQRAIAAVDERDGPLMAGLAALPAGQRTVLVLRFTDDLSLEEIAKPWHLRRHGIGCYAIEDRQPRAFLGWIGLEFGYPAP